MLGSRLLVAFRRQSLVDEARMSRPRARPRPSLLQRFRALPPVVQAIGGLLGVVSTAIGLVFLLDPGLRPGETSTPPAKIAGNLTYLGLERNVAYGIHLAADRLSPHGYSPAQLKRHGNVMEVSASLVGLQGSQVPLVWSLYHAEGTNRTPLARTQYLNQPIQPIQLTGGQFAGILYVWIPTPDVQGHYIARILVLYHQAVLRSVDSDVFAGEPTTNPAPPVPPILAGTVCGLERWQVKTLADPQARAINPQPQATSVHDLVGLRAPATLAPRRIPPVELSTYNVKARLVEYKLEEDSDIHLVVADPSSGETMIAEFPADGCTQGAAPTARKQMSQARTALLKACGPPRSDPRLTTFEPLSGTATLRGVGFFDSIHGQAGVARNGIELHPVLYFRTINCRTK